MIKRHPRAFSLIEISIVVLIVGILTAGITLSSKLIRKSAIVNAQSLTRGSKIDQIPDMVLWYETTLSGSVSGASNKQQPENNEEVYGWKDLNPSIVTNNVVQSTSANRPLYKLGAINNLPAIKFDGSNDYFQISNNVTGHDFTLFTVFRTSDPGYGDGTGLAWQSSIIFSADYPNVYFDVIPLAFGGGKPKIGVGDNNSGHSGANNEETVLVGSSAINDDKPHIVMTSRTQGTGLRTIYVDGVSAASSSSAASGGYSPIGSRDTSTVMMIGYSVQSFNGYIGEIIIFNRILKQNERKAVESYLGKKWGVTIS